MKKAKRGRSGLASVRFLQRIRLIVFDFDGVFTDNGVLVGEDGAEFVLCNRADGLGVTHLRRQGVECMVLSTETNAVVSKRCEKLKLEYCQGISDKWPALKEILKEKRIDPADVAYVGNDINDLDCMKNVGVAICVADAYPEVKSAAHFVTSRPGGKGAVREICDLIMRAKKGGSAGATYV